MITKFLTTYTRWKPQDKLAIAVSGGSDSLALLYQAAEHIDNNKITAITFDHGLRKESKDEALYVKKCCDQLGVKHVILSPQAEEMGKNSQNWARGARYRHLLAYCMQKKIPYLLFAHHYEDQKETLYIRLLQGSHLYGMCGMQSVRNIGDVCIVRPFLKEKKEKLKQYLQHKNIDWINDPSNENNKYLRVKIRKYLQNKPQESITVPYENIEHWRNHINNIVTRWLLQYAQQEASQIIVSKQALLSLPLELQLHIIQRLLDIMGKTPYQPSLQDIHDKILAITTTNNSVLHHCMIHHRSQHIHFQQEYARGRMGKMTFLGKNYGVFDDRFHIGFPKGQTITVKPLGSCINLPQDNIQQLCADAKKLKNRHILSLPVVFLSQSEYILPMIHGLSWCDHDIYVQRIKRLNNI